MTPKSTARLVPFEVRQNERVAEGTWRMVLATGPGLASGLRPGMFVNVRPAGDSSQVIRIPLSFASADAEAGTVEIVYATVGIGTERLSQMAPGTTSTLVGPLGRGWRLPASRERALLVAGGVGLPPVMAAAGMLAQAGIGSDVVLGARSAGRLWREGIARLERLGCEVHVATDDGSEGAHGLTTDVVAGLLSGGHSYGSAFSCGPNPMMAGVARMAHEAQIPCQVSLERMMTCGFGACSTCNVALAAGGYASCCMDGPVFDAEEVAW